MPVVLQHCDELPVTSVEVASLWAAAAKARGHGDDQVTVRCVDGPTMQELNSQYRHQNKPTNVLTFSYPSSDFGQAPEHDVALCLPVAQQEAAVGEVPLKDYAAQLLAHAFLHACGLDHERSAAEAEEMEQGERAVLAQCGFAAHAS